MGDRSEDVFNYVDPRLQSSLISAVVADDLIALKRLLASGHVVNINNNRGNTPLHVSIAAGKQEIFDYLLSLDDVLIDLANFESRTPLCMALENRQADDYFALRLIAQGANINHVQYDETTPLHYAAARSAQVNRALLDKGAQINAQDYNGETPLHFACHLNNDEVIHMLLCYGADPTIPCVTSCLPFTYSLKYCSPETQDVLFLYTFDEHRVEMNLYTVERMMKLASPFFYKLMDQNVDVMYNDHDLAHILSKFDKISSDMLQRFVSKFEHVASKVFQEAFLGLCYRMDTFPVTDPQKLGDYFVVLCESGFIEDASVTFDPLLRLCDWLIKAGMDEDTLTKVICALLSYGFEVTTDDFNSVYKRFGFCELFKVMLHMKIYDYPCRNKRNSAIPDLPLPMLCYDVGLDFERGYEVVRRLEGRLYSLVEFSRDAARKHIIQKYNIKDNVQYYTILNALPIGSIHKAILSYETHVGHPSNFNI